MRSILAGVLASALVVPAFAGPNEVKDVEVYDQRSQKLGEVTDVVTNPNGNVEQVVIEVAGGEEDRAVAVPLDQVKMRGDRIVLAMSRDQLAAMPPHRQ
jgi:sporulation protein YlmC with PRC-barrel domain